MTDPLDKLRRQAKALKRGYEAGEDAAQIRLRQYVPAREAPKYADFLHVIAREQGFESWPRLKVAAETVGLDRAARQQRLKIALYHGQNHVVRQLLQDTPDLAEGAFGLQVALLNRAAVARMLANDPTLATQNFGPRRPILHLAFSKWIHADPALEADMLAIAEMLVDHGADVNDGFPFQPGDDHLLSALYGAIGHADNMVLGQWLLDHGADPNDGESLYHATELGHHKGLRMLLAAGAEPRGTNALLRAIDFNDHTAVQVLLGAGAQVQEFNADPVGGEAPYVIPALHQAARRGVDARMVELLLEAGADPSLRFKGRTAYGYARVFGQGALARAIEARTRALALDADEVLLADVAVGEVIRERRFDPLRLPVGYENLLHEIIAMPGKLPHAMRLVSAGWPHERADSFGMTPLHLAAWEGLPEVMGWLLGLGCDLTHVNGYGGTLLGTIVHGADNCPNRADRDYITCAKLALDHGAPVLGREADESGDPELSEYLRARLQPKGE
ncbi:ankyrin repeat-containing protein [Actibacterium atlanticum]|uniref:Ankyrin repeat-containing protein n=1 Tax=Actibacterium atlanticum TaxID=1461693 RepID=A0A058ZHY9_9RHOB|nr:ankyrin repeat domain-containing protein [Actibacterium atlanticum]KCV81193.1 ankyrin repeat-containing protein [Actibacterium atlanticum]